MNSNLLCFRSSIDRSASRPCLLFGQVSALFPLSTLAPSLCSSVETFKLLSTLRDASHRLSKAIFKMPICVESFVHRIFLLESSGWKSPQIASFSSTISRLKGTVSTLLSSILLPSDCGSRSRLSECTSPSSRAHSSGSEKPTIMQTWTWFELVPRVFLNVSQK